MCSELGGSQKMLGIYQRPSEYTGERVRETLGAEGVISSRQIEGFLRDFKQFTHNIPSGKIVGFF